jgi:hypothetical protein
MKVIVGGIVGLVVGGAPTFTVIIESVIRTINVRAR